MQKRAIKNYSKNAKLIIFIENYKNITTCTSLTDDNCSVFK